ncbi:hypothetical protein IWX90DRAFT_487297 [Phyllosticta citrichinensis]|uniref:Translation initiation factor 3 N-terminal domain-containing protein n=1 Tax=Phyllosticta citrichinensis TaxID=1130410 RepID=A0ABR1XR56_9PEZI
MAAPRQLIRPAQALARVLAQPSFQPARFNLAAKLQIPVALPITQIRTAVRKPFTKDRDKDPRVQKSVVDEQIGSLYVNIVQDDGTFVPEQRLRDVLKDMDRISYFLLQVAKAQEDHEHPYPVCRIIPKDELRNMEKEKNRKKKTWDDLTKMVEITWSIAKHDLDNQMKRMTQFLEQGLRVEVVLGPKKRGRTATPEEIEAVHKKIKETVASIPGIKEYAEAEGEVGRVLSLFYGKPKEKVAEEQEKQKEEAAAEAQKAEDEDTSKKSKKVSRYKIKEEEKRRQAVAEELQARNRERRAALEDPGSRDTRRTNKLA